MTGDKSFELDFYICADRNSPAVQEIEELCAKLVIPFISNTHRG